MVLTKKGRSESGFSLLEVLFASVILLAALLGVAGLFMRSMANNVEGRESSVVSSLARTGIEEMQAILLEHPVMQVPGGSAEAQVDRYWDESTHDWVASVPPSSPWKRTTRIQLFNVSDLYDDPVGQLPKFNNPLDGATPVEHVSLREIQVVIDGQRETGALGARRNIDVTTMRSF